VLKANRLVLASGLLYLILALGHIPVDIFPYGFDKNAPVHFVFLMITAIAFAAYIILRHNRFELPLKVIVLIWGLVLALLASTLNAPDLIGSLTGDSGRYTGAVSLFCLIVIAIYHSQFSLAQIHKLAQIYVTTIFIVSVIGLLQHYKVIDMPGDSGVTGTLGNLDFFGAYVGTGFALFVYLMPTVPRPRKILFTFFILVNLYAVYLAGPLQSYVDIAIILIAVLIYRFRSYIPRYDVTLNAKTFFGTVGLDKLAYPLLS